MGLMDNLSYIVYSRKSSEAKEKQALSIQDQNAECNKCAFDNNLKISYKLEESKSAFKPHNRPEFDTMLETIRDGRANAILTWKPDRLCRNPEEGGILLQMLQDGKIKEIRTPLGDIYTPDSDHLILQIHFGMANQYSRVLSQNVRRGLYRKVIDRKEYPRMAPLGYEGCGERGQRNIKPHLIEARHIKKAFELASLGSGSLDQISNVLHGEGFRTKKGKRISKSHLQTILKNPMYYGFFLVKGELYEGNYEPLISKGLFDLVQMKLADRSKPKQILWDKEFSMFRCGGCGCAITLTNKKKYIKKTKEWKVYSYYHCTHRKGSCSEKPVKADEFKKLLLEQIEHLVLDQAAWELGIKLVRAKYGDELQKTNNHFQNLKKDQSNVRDRINSLIAMRSNGELTKDEFMEQKGTLLDKLASLNRLEQDNEHSLKTWLELTEDFFNTAFSLKEVVEAGTPEQKKRVLSKVGENYLLQGGNIVITYRKPYDVLLQPAMRQAWLGSQDSNLEIFASRARRPAVRRLPNVKWWYFTVVMEIWLV